MATKNNDTVTKRTRTRRTPEQRAADLEQKMRQAQLEIALGSIEDPEVQAVARAFKRVSTSLGQATSDEATKALRAAAKPLTTYLSGLGIEIA